MSEAGKEAPPDQPPVGEDDGQQLRIRKLTPAADDLYEEKVKYYYGKINSYTKTLDSLLLSTELEDSQLTELQTTFQNYEEQYKIFSHFLKTVRSDKSTQELVTLGVIYNEYSYKVNKVFEPEVDTKTVISRISQRSRVSHTSRASNYSQVKAKAEALLASRELIEKEKMLLMEQARIEEARSHMKAESDRKQPELKIELDLLKKEKELYQAQLELKVLEEAEIKPEISPVKAVKVEKKEETVKETISTTPKVKYETVQPTTHTSTPGVDLSKLFLKKELLMQRLRKYDDKPENYQMWKESFKLICTDLGLSPIEEFDLLLKYLGPESVKYAERIYASNAGNPKVGLEMLWKRLYERYGSPELIERALKQRLTKFPRITKDTERLFELSDILHEVSSYMENYKYKTLLSYFNSSVGVLPIVSKLPNFIRTKWISHASRYKVEHDVVFPPFTVFVKFIDDTSTMLNDPGLAVADGGGLYTADINKSQITRTNNTTRTNNVHVRKTDIEQTTSYCPFHERYGHSLNSCRTFKKKSTNQRKQFLKDKKICFKCCDSNEHIFKNCTVSPKCVECGSQTHVSAMHVYRDKDNNELMIDKTENYGGQNVLSKCTQVCGNGFVGRSCSKTILTKVSLEDNRDKNILCYVIIDDQSNRTLCHPDLFHKMNINGSSPQPYLMTTCSGDIQVQGRQLSNLVLTSLDGDKLQLPVVTECEFLPHVLSEVATPEVISNFEHLRDVSVPPLHEDASVLLLIGRDVPEAHHILEQRIGPQGTPFAQRLRLGWTVIGQVCLDGLHIPTKVTNFKTNILDSGRPSLFEQCDNHVVVKDIFWKTSQDENIGLSREDKEFLASMDKQFAKDEDGHWTAPLPFRTDKPALPSNKKQALKRAQLLHTSLMKNSVKRNDMLGFMTDILENYAEVAPPLKENEEHWYLPIFGIYHPQKNKVRAVFDSSAKFEGVSLNNVLLSGPDLNNSLVGVLLRFRQGAIGVTGDIQKMFYQFRVTEKHRNYLRFLWYRNNDFNDKLIEFRMKVHVFGNSPSPAVAIYGLHRTADQTTDEDVRDCIKNNFYVDDGLIPCDTVDSAIHIVSKTKDTLNQYGRLRLHKFTSNNGEVLKTFEPSDLSTSLQELDLENGVPVVQRSLGLYWDMLSDSFTFRCQARDQPATRRGVLATVNGLYDPLGIAAPVSLKGKLIFRDTNNLDWDVPLPEKLEKEWLSWTSSLEDLNQVNIPRQFTKSCSLDSEKQLYIYADASQHAISAVAYMKDIEDGSFGFVMGKAKVAPKHGHTIPRLELCAALLAVQLGSLLTHELKIPLETIHYFTDSKVVLGYLNNSTRRFYIYVENRVNKILAVSSTSQWSYISTHLNPADDGTRGLSSNRLQESGWLSGPKVTPEIEPCTFPSSTYC